MTENYGIGGQKTTNNFGTAQSRSDGPMKVCMHISFIKIHNYFRRQSLQAFSIHRGQSGQCPCVKKHETWYRISDEQVCTVSIV